MGDRRTHFCQLEERSGEIVPERVITTTRAAPQGLLTELPRMRVVLDTGSVRSLSSAAGDVDAATGSVIIHGGLGPARRSEVHVLQRP